VTTSRTGVVFLIMCLGACAALAACSSKNSGQYPTSTPGDAATAATGAGGASMPSGTVLVQIQSPMDGTRLSTNAAADVSAKITIGAGTDLVDPATVLATLTAKNSVSVLSSAPLVGPSGDSAYVGKLSLAGLKTGSYTITVSAASSTGTRGSAQVTIDLDAGPQITVLSPIPGHHYKDNLIVQIVADPGAFAPLQATPQASIGGAALSLQPAGPPNQFRAAVDLTMPVALTGAQLFVVSAVDKNGTRTELRFSFVVDIDGPEITETQPIPGQIVGGLIRISAQISDGAGINSSSVQVLIGDKTNAQFKLALTPDATGTYSVLFDTKSLTGCKPAPSMSLCIVHPTLSFRAADLLGNESTVAYEISVDNIPPVADLVPPDIRVSKFDDTPLPDGGPPPAGVVCSHLFSPLSRRSQVGDMPHDGCVVPQVFDLRARIEDDSNYAVGLKLGPISTVDPDATAVYVLDDVSQPLVVDTDGDGNCDAINPNLTPTTTPLTGPRQVLKIRLRPVPPAGDGNYTADPTVPPECNPGRATNVPTNICETEQPFVAISYAGKLPAIWSIEPIAPASPGYCFGGQFDTLANNVTDAAWKCIAVATADKNGNASVSAPIRVWVDYQLHGGGTFCGAHAGAPAAPTCTGSYNRATGAATAGACSTLKFPMGEICFENHCS